MLYPDWKNLPPPPETHQPHQDRVYQLPYYTQRYVPAHQEQHHHHHHQQQQQHLHHHHHNINNLNSLPSLPSYGTYAHQQQQQQQLHHQQQHEQLKRQRQPPNVQYSHFPQEPLPEHPSYHIREHVHGPSYSHAPYSHGGVTAPIPPTQMHCSSNAAPEYGQNMPYLTMEDRPRHSLPTSIPNDTSHHLYQHLQHSMSHYRYPMNLPHTPSSAAVNASIPSWSSGAPDNESGYGGPSIRPKLEATFAGHSLRNADEPSFPRDHSPDSTRRLPYSYVQQPQPYPYYHDHGREHPSTHTDEQNHSHRRIPCDNHFMAYAQQEASHQHQYHHPYVPSPTLRSRPLSPSGNVPPVILYDSPACHDPADCCPRSDEGGRILESSTAPAPLANTMNTNPTPLSSLERKTEGEHRCASPHEIAGQCQAIHSCDHEFHPSGHPEDETHPPKPSRFPSLTVTPLSTTDSLTELANASLITTNHPKTTMEEYAYPSPSSSTFSDKPLTVPAASPMLQGMRRDQHIPSDHVCSSWGGLEPEAVGDGWTDGGKRVTHPCKECSKACIHNTNVVAQQWEHTTTWKESSKYPLSQIEKIQILDAAAILSNLKTIHATPSATATTSSSSSSSYVPASDTNSRASTPGTITQPSSPHLSSNTLGKATEAVSAFSIRSLLDASPNEGPSVVENKKTEKKAKAKPKGRKTTRRKVSI